MALLTKEAIEKALKDLANWEIRDEVLYKKFIFSNFVEAFGFMTMVAFFAEKHNHHPDWKNSYNQVEVELTTHEEGGITEKDIQLAKRIDEIFQQMKK